MEYQLGYVQQKGENSGGDSTMAGVFLPEDQAEQNAKGNQREEIQQKGVENDRYILCARGLRQFKKGSEWNDVGECPGVASEVGCGPYIVYSVDYGGPKQAYHIEDHDDFKNNCI